MIFECDDGYNCHEYSYSLQIHGAVSLHLQRGGLRVLQWVNEPGFAVLCVVT